MAVAALLFLEHNRSLSLQRRGLFDKVHRHRVRCPGWTVALMSPDDSLSAHTGLSLEPVVSTANGGLPVAIRLGTVT